VAIDWYEKAESQRSPENDDATLRWNSFARIIANRNLKKRPPDENFVVSK